MFGKMRRIRLKTVLISSFLLILAFSLLYIFQVNNLTLKTKKLSLIQDQLERYSQGNENLEIKLTESDSFSDLEILAADLDFEKIQEIRYISSIEGTVAVK